MGISEKSRHELHSRLEEVLGPAPAGTLMEMTLPPMGWADVATKSDLEAHAKATRSDLEAHAKATKGDLEILEHKLVATFRGEMAVQTRTILLTLVGILIPYAGVIFAAAKLA